MSIDHFSASQLGMFQRCGEQWRRRYLENEIIPPGIAARVGTGVHAAAELNFRQKIESGMDLPLDVLQDAAADGYHKALSDGVFIAPDEVSGARLAMAAGKDQAVSLATLFRTRLAPSIQPALVEHRVILDLGLELPVITVLDVYTTAGELRDLKTAGKKWTQDKADSSPQPTLYRESVRQETGAYPAALIFDVLVNGKSPSLQTVSTTRGDDDLDVLKAQFRLMERSINAGIFAPALPDSWICSPKWCGYYYSCRYIPAGRRCRKAS